MRRMAIRSLLSILCVSGAVAIGIPRLVQASDPKCHEVADRILEEGGFATLESHSRPPVVQVMVGAAIELTRERYRTGKFPDYRWLDAEKAPKADVVTLINGAGNTRAAVFAVGNEGKEQITQFAIQGQRNGTSGAVSTWVRLDANCKITEFVTDPQDLGHATRQLTLSAKSCAPVFEAEVKNTVPFTDGAFSLAAAKKILPFLANDDPTFVEALSSRPDSSFIHETIRFYSAKLALCRASYSDFSDPSGLLAKYRRFEMKDRSADRNGHTRKSGGGR